MTPSAFGEHLKRERELRGVSLDEIAAATRIKTAFLDAIENGRWEELPGGAFNRGFVRATARFLGLDEDGMVAEYAVETGTAAQNKPVATPSGALPRNYRPAAIAIGGLVVLAIGIAWFGHHEYSLHKQKRSAAAGQQAIVRPAGAATAGASGEATGGTVAVATTTAPADASKQSASAPAEAPGAAVATPPAASSAAMAPLKLKVEASKRTDVKIVGDGKLLFKGRLHSDAPKNFEAREGFEVTADDVNVVQLTLNDRNIPFANTGGHHGSVSIGRKDLKPAGETSR